MHRNHIKNYLSLVFILLFRHISMAQEHYFEVASHNVKVQEGEEVILECKVAFLNGDVYWTKDGIPLGPLPIVNDFPRYAVIVDQRYGTYNLRLSNVSLEDDAVYQCQVVPINFNSSIWANVRLNVTSPPSFMELFNHQTDFKIELKENQNLNLECHVHSARPAAKIVWYRNNVEFNPPNREDYIIDMPVEIGDRRMIRYNTDSFIGVKLTGKDDHTKYTCEAHHEDLSPDSPMKISVEFRVLYPPGPPHIEVFTEGNFKRGQTVQLVCTSQGGNPLAQLIWFKNGDKFKISHTFTGTVSKDIYMFIANASDNKARYECEASNIMSKSPLKAEVDMSVLFSPSHVTISGPTQARVGNPVPLTCTTAKSNPPAEIKWMVAGKEVQNASSRVIVSPEGGWITTSNITAIVEENQRSLVVICRGMNMQLSEKVFSNHTINILFSPSHVTISGPPQARVGDAVPLTCTTTNSNPAAEIKWMIVEKDVRNASSRTVVSPAGGWITTSNITAIVKENQRSLVVICRGLNMQLTENVFSNHTINILYGDHMKKGLWNYLLEKQNYPRIVIITMLVIGNILLFINIIFVADYILRTRAKITREQNNQISNARTDETVTEVSGTYPNEGNNNECVDASQLFARCACCVRNGDGI